MQKKNSLATSLNTDIEVRSLSRLRSIPPENIEGKHPDTLILFHWQRLVASANKVFDFLDRNDKSDDIAGSYKNFCYEAAELTEAYRRALNKISGDKQVNNRFNTKCKKVRDNVSYMVNKLKHEDRDIRTVYVRNDIDNALLAVGFVLVKQENPECLVLDKRIHREEQRAISYLHHLCEVLCAAVLIESIMEETLSSLNIEKVDIDSPFDGLSRLNQRIAATKLLVFPGETKVENRVFPVLDSAIENSKQIYYSLNNVCVENSFSGDGRTKSFPLVNV
ncbi:MAG: hypothetical protein IID08_10255 [Candidatus Hydrogenedentes bacterium]|nr:hypothetical protein [Candidatus Hydrogenedentota bacterium]